VVGDKWKILSVIFLVIAIISAFIAGYYVQKVNELTSTGAATAEWDRYLGRNVQQIFEDSAGNIWFAGENPGWGVAKFDGENWEIYDACDIKGISAAIGIGEDNCGNVWVGTYVDGLSKFDGNEWTNHNAINSELLICNQIDLLFSDSSRNIWIETLKEGNGIVTYNGIQCEYVIYKISDGNWTMYDKDTTGAGKSHCEYIDQIFEDWEGNLWFTGEIEGAIKFNGENWTVYNESEIGLKHVYSMFQDRNINLWFGGCDRVVKLDRNGNITKYSIDGTVYDIIQDRDGNTYFATLAGVNVIPRDCNCSFTLLECGMYPLFHSMFCDDKGRIWFLTDENGVFVYVREYTSEQQGLYHYDIREPMTFFQDSSGSMWIGTLDGVLKFKE
jgi:ligand-binding sensor domain-containing protein